MPNPSPLAAPRLEQREVPGQAGRPPPQPPTPPAPHPPPTHPHTRDEFPLIGVQHHCVHRRPALVLALAAGRPQVPDLDCRKGKRGRKGAGR